MLKKKVSELQYDILKIKNENPTFNATQIARIIHCSPRYARETIQYLWKTDENEIIDDDTVGDVVLSALKSEKKNQKLRDQQRIERKIRENYRYDNSLEELTKKLISIFQKRPKYSLKKHKNIKNNYTGIFHITDTHLNELINIEGNQYDFSIASKRLRKMVLEAKKIFNVYGIKNILVAFTGDLLNSDRRLDELLNQATNRAKACALSAILFEQMILDLNESFNISIASVSGNEGRVKDEYGISEIMISDNYDFTILEILRLMFRRNPEIKFIKGSSAELVVQLQNKNILLIHGQQIKANHMTSIQSIRGKYSDIGIKLDFVIYGHLHSTLLTDFYARSSSLCGANAYSDNELQFSSKASQNIHIIGDSDIHSIKIDLQNTDNIIGYDIEKDLEAYNAKAYTKISWNKPKKI